ncbi:MAG: hypothetical protein QXH51_04085 [Candidatus Bathyarchaeia archaeon]
MDEMARVDPLSIARKHYLSSDVQKEIIDFCRGRWVAAHHLTPSGKLVLRRYISGKPMKIERREDIEELTNYMGRSVYATANVYGKIEDPFDPYDRDNIIYSTPTWDIDCDLPRWKATLKAAKEIIEFLGDWGIRESVYVKWSGNGCHLHINERSISEGLLEKYGPLDIAYAIVEYVNIKLAKLFIMDEVKVENKMDPARVFTCPLSLHRELNVACVCIKPEDLSKFTPEWINPQSFRHDPRWREFREGETDRLAEAAYKTVGGYPLKPGRRRRKTKPLDEQIVEWLQRD